MPRKIQTALNVPNTVKGRAFIRQLRAYAVYGTRVVLRGRGPRKPNTASLPLGLATSFATYIRTGVKI
jgi:hypothetical protein